MLQIFMQHAKWGCWLTAAPFCACDSFPSIRLHRLCRLAAARSPSDTSPPGPSLAFLPRHLQQALPPLIHLPRTRLARFWQLLHLLLPGFVAPVHQSTGFDILVLGSSRLWPFLTFLVLSFRGSAHSIAFDDPTSSGGSYLWL